MGGVVVCFALFLAAMAVCLVMGWSFLWALLLGLALFTLHGRKQGHSLQTMWGMAWSEGRKVLIVLRIFVFIGAITALWRSGGTIAKAARDRGILTVGIVTLPFHAEGRKRVDQANRGLEELRKNVDSLVVIHNDNIAKIYGSLPLEEAFGKADDILATAAKGIAELITREGNVNVDFADVKAVMTDGGMALMGSGRASGEDKIAKVTEAALSSPLLNHQEIKGARDILFNLSYSPGQISFDEATSVLEMIQRKASRGIGDPHSANIIWGAGVDPSLDDEIVLTIVATGFDNVNALGTQQGQQQAAERPATGGIFHTAGRKPQTNANVIHVRKTNRLGDIEKYLATPAYIRRNVRLTNAVPGSGKISKVSMKDETDAPQQAEQPENDLFGQH